MNRRKTISLILVLTIILTCFAACGSPSNTPSKSDDEKNPGISSDKPDSMPSMPSKPDDEKNPDFPNEEPDPSPNLPNIGNNENKIEPSRISYAYEYQSGLSFVHLDDLNSPLYCIDKAGSVLFSIARTEDKAYELIHGFVGKYAVFAEHSKSDTNIVLCNKQGELIRAEDIGATAFLMDQDFHETMYMDGYIFAIRETSSYQGSVTELAVFNTDLEKLVDFSADFYTEYMSHLFFFDAICYNGYLFNAEDDDYYIDLNAGEICNNIADLNTKITLKNKSDFWRYENGIIYDLREIRFLDGNKTPVIDLVNLHGGTVGYASEYCNGTAWIWFETETKDYFSVIDEKGQLQFDPVEIEEGTIKSENGIYVVDYAVNYSQTHCLVVFDSTGKIAEKEYTSHGNIEFSDGVIIVNEAGTYHLYTTTLEPLF